MPTAAGAPGAATGTEESGGSAPTAAPAAPKPIGADIALGPITLSGGHVDYSDFFIKPNYRANMTDISGKVGAFGTSTTTPADVVLAGQINGSAPLNITGSINPLTPLAAVDITAKANGIELTDLTAYSVKYTGYPITKGTLTVDVHYLLDKQMLTAANHIFLDQLTFGDKVPSPTAMNLPMRLAVAILKDSKGQINLDIPISGSLNDPKFSLGAIVLNAFMNILTKAVTAPFRLLAGAIGNIAGGSNGEDLSYVVYAPGRSTLTPDKPEAAGYGGVGADGPHRVEAEYRGTGRSAGRQAGVAHGQGRRRSAGAGERRGGHDASGPYRQRKDTARISTTST